MTLNYEIKITKAKNDGAANSKTVAYVKINFGTHWVTYRLEISGGKYYLNPPSHFVESLKGRDLGDGAHHSGWIDDSGMTAELIQEIKSEVLSRMELRDAA